MSTSRTASSRHRKMRRHPERIPGCVAVHRGACEPYDSGEAPDQRLAECPRCRRHFCMHEGASDSPLCDMCWGRVGERERGYWAGLHNWGREGRTGKFDKGYEAGCADREDALRAVLVASTPEQS